MAKKKTTGLTPSTPVKDTARAFLLTSAPQPGEPATHFAMCWLHREIESMAAAINGEQPPHYKPLPKPPWRKT